MGRKCCAYGCKSGYDSQQGKSVDQLITMHRYPIKNKELCEKWLRANPRKDFKPTINSGLCSLHFTENDFVEFSLDKNSSRNKRSGVEKRALCRRYLKKDAVPSVFENASACTSCEPRPSTRTTSKNMLEEEGKQLVTLEPTFAADDDVSRSSLSEIRDEIVNETATPKSFQITILKGDLTQRCRDTNVSRQQNKLCEKQKTRHLKDDAVPSVFPNTSTGTCLSKTQVAPRSASGASTSSRYPEEEKRLESVQQTSLENDDISSLTLTEVEEQPRGEKCDIPSKTTVQTTVRDKHFMNVAETLLKYREHGFLCDAVLVAKCGRELKAHSALLAAVSPVFLMAIEEKPSSGPYHLCFPEVELEVLEIAVHFIYTGKLLLPTVYSHTDQLSVLFNKLSDLGLSLHKLHECKMTFVRSAKQPPISLKSVKAECLAMKSSLKDSVQKLQASCGEWPVEKKPSFADTFNEVMIIDVASNDVRSSQTGESEESSRSTLAKQKGQENWEQKQQKRKHRKTGNKNGKKERIPSNALVPKGPVVTKPVKRPAFSILKALLDDPNTPVAALSSSGTSSRELNNLPVGLLLDQNVGKINTLDSSSVGIHEAIVNDNGEPNPKTQKDIFNLVDPPPNEGTLRPNGVEKLADKASISSTEAQTCECCKDPNVETFKNETEVLWDKIEHHWDQCNVCNYCGCRLSSRKSLKDHIKRHLGILPRPIKNHKCNDCGLHFMTPTQLKNHRVRHTGEKPHECPDCRKRFTLRENMERHKLLHTGYHPFLCDFCGKGFTRKLGLSNHMTAYHEFECALCSCKQTSKADMEKHAFEVHQLSQPYKFNSIIKHPRTYLCDLCGKNCISACSLWQHMKGHRNKPVHCEMLGKKFSKSSELRVHTRFHTGERPFVCDFCQKGFSQKSVLMMHLTTHSGFKPLDCFSCSKSPASKGQLKQHLTAHTQHMKQHTTAHIEKKPFKCGICNNQFTSKGSLMVHHRIHTGEKPYKCRICSKQFISNSTLTIHIRTHTGDKPFTCKVCLMTFAQSQHLGRHMRTHTGEKPFVCEICSKGYRQKIDLRYHFMNFHKIDVTMKPLSENIEIDRKNVSDTSVCIVDKLKHDLDN